MKGFIRLWLVSPLPLLFLSQKSEGEVLIAKTSMANPAWWHEPIANFTSVSVSGAARSWRLLTAIEQHSSHIDLKCAHSIKERPMNRKTFVGLTTDDERFCEAISVASSCHRALQQKRTNSDQCPIPPLGWPLRFQTRRHRLARCSIVPEQIATGCPGPGIKGEEMLDIVQCLLLGPAFPVNLGPVDYFTTVDNARNGNRYGLITEYRQRRHSMPAVPDAEAVAAFMLQCHDVHVMPRDASVIAMVLDGVESLDQPLVFQLALPGSHRAMESMAQLGSVMQTAFILSRGFHYSLVFLWINIEPGAVNGVSRIA